MFLTCFTTFTTQLWNILVSCFLYFVEPSPLLMLTMHHWRKSYVMLTVHQLRSGVLRLHEATFKLVLSTYHRTAAFNIISYSYACISCSIPCYYVIPRYYAIPCYYVIPCYHVTTGGVCIFVIRRSSLMRSGCNTDCQAFNFDIMSE